MIRVSKEQLLERLAQRPPEYLAELEPAIVRRHADGSINFDDTHPAWRAMMAKYQPVREAPAPPQRPPAPPCQGCGGAKYNPQDFNRPGGPDELIQQLG